MADIGAIRASLPAEKRIAFVSGNFNVVHPGHVRLLKFAAENADFLIVGVNPDRSPGVTVAAPLRVDGVRSISFVSHALILEIALEDFLSALRPDIVVKGKEFETLPNPEQAIIESYGGKLIFSSGEVGFSSIDLLQRDYVQPTFQTIQIPADYPIRHGFDLRDLNAILGRFNGIRVLVVGDSIVDKYIDCDPLGMSQEDPTIVVTPVEQATFLGGAAIVAAHARGLGADVRFVTVVGNDPGAEVVRSSLDAYGVAFDAFRDLTRPTTTKERYRANGKTLLRINYLRQHAIDYATQTSILSRVQASLHQTDLVLLSDFNYGCLPQPLVDAIVEMTARRGIMMAADSQASSQLADISRFKGMKVITPTEREARLAMRDPDSGLVAVAERLRQMAQADNVVVTLGAEGLLIHTGRRDEIYTDRLPAFNTAPKDTAGAGDSLFASLSLALCAKVDIWRGAFLGAVAAACQVARVGNKPITRADLIAEIKLASDGRQHRFGRSANN